MACSLPWTTVDAALNHQSVTKSTSEIRSSNGNRRSPTFMAKPWSSLIDGGFSSAMLDSQRVIILLLGNLTLQWKIHHGGDIDRSPAVENTAITTQHMRLRAHVVDGLGAGAPSCGWPVAICEVGTMNFAGFSYKTKPWDAISLMINR